MSKNLAKLQTLYDIKKSFLENCDNGPVFTGPLPVRIVPDKKYWHTFLGFEVASQIGVPACALMTGKGIALASQLGFDILTYKTIRSSAHAPHAHPNIVYVDVPYQLDSSLLGETVQTTTEIPTTTEQLAIANSFGNNSGAPDCVQTDIEYARNSLSDGQVLIVSVFGEEQQKRTIEQDFVYTAQLAYEAGAQVIEANVSCPNVTCVGGALYLDVEKVYTIGRALVQALPNVPILIKVGFFPDKETQKKTMLAAHRAGIVGICGINSVRMRVVDEDNNPAFDVNRLYAGVSGEPIRALAMTFINNSVTICQQEKLDLTILATGGIMNAHYAKMFLKAGAHVALTATGMMWNPYLAAQFHELTYHEALSTHAYSAREQLALKLFDIGAIKFGEFKLKSGIISPIYIDLRVIISYPEVLKLLSECMWEQLKQCDFDLICGVPYTALPIATTLSITHNKPLIMHRKEKKDYGTCKMVEGVFKPGQRVVIIEDLITSGASILETVSLLEQEKLVVDEVVVLIDREQGGKRYLNEKGYKVHSIFTIFEILSILERAKKIHRSMIVHVHQFIREHQF